EAGRRRDASTARRTVGPEVAELLVVLEASAQRERRSVRGLEQQLRVAARAAPRGGRRRIVAEVALRLRLLPFALHLRAERQRGSGRKGELEADVATTSPRPLGGGVH